MNLNDQRTYAHIDVIEPSLPGLDDRDYQSRKRGTQLGGFLKMKITDSADQLVETVTAYLGDFEQMIEQWLASGHQAGDGAG